MQANTKVTLQGVTILENQKEWLVAMASEFSLPDASKALRCLIEFVVQEADKKSVFEVMRCGMPTGESKNKVEEDYQVEGAQKEWLEKMTADYKLPDLSKTLRCVLAWAMSEGDKQSIFTVVRKTCNCDPAFHKCGRHN